MPKYNTRYIRANGEDKDLLMQRQFFGSVGPWQDCAYYNNDVYRSQVKLNELYADFCEEYAKQVKLTKKRTQLHKSCNALFQHEGVGPVKEGVKLPFRRKDKKPLFKPSTEWLRFASVIKHGVNTEDGSPELATKVTLSDESAGSKDFNIEPTKQNNQSNKNHRRGGQQNGQN